jgi:hypothetical protein
VILLSTLVEAADRGHLYLGLWQTGLLQHLVKTWVLRELTENFLGLPHVEDLDPLVARDGEERLL